MTTRKRKSDEGTGMPPHRPRPLAVPQDQPAERVDLPYGLAVELFLAAARVCSECGEPADRVSADGGVCTSCSDPWDAPGRRAS